MYQRHLRPELGRGQARFPVLKGSWDLVTRVFIRVTILITPIKVLITLLTKSHDPPSRTIGAFTIP